MNIEELWLPVSAGFSHEKDSEVIPEGLVRRWALVLDARHIHCRIEPSVAGWQLLVPAEQLNKAMEELRLFEEENRDWPPPPPPASPLAENTLSTLSVLILLATFHNLTRLDIPLFGNYFIDWIEIGKAHAGNILDGQWWRLITALTLHSDWAHLLGNLTIGGFFIVCLCRDLGSGLAWSVLLGSGILGNLANSLLQLPDHSSVGASTTVFGAVGALAALSLVRYRRHRQKRWAIPVAGALALLALLGTEGKNTDLGAHLFGFLFGLILGAMAEYLAGKFGRPGKTLNALLALASAMAVLTAWWAAVACEAGLP